MLRPLSPNHPTSVALHRVLDGGNQIVRGQGSRPAMLPRATMMPRSDMSLFGGAPASAQGASVGAAAPATDPRGAGQVIEDKATAAYDWTSTLLTVLGFGTLVYFGFQLMQHGKTTKVLHESKREAMKRAGVASP